MSFKMSNASIEDENKIGELGGRIGQLFAAVEQLQGGGGGGVNILTLSGGGSAIYYQPSGTIVYSLEQDPGQIVVDADVENGPAPGTEYTIVTSGNNSIYIQTQKPGGRIQISGTSTNTSNLNVIMAANNNVCRVIKLTSTLWIVHGDNLSYDG